MSDAPADPNEYQRQQQQQQQRQPTSSFSLRSPAQPQTLYAPVSGISQERSLLTGDVARPSLRSYRSFPSSLGASGLHQQEVSQGPPNVLPPGAFYESDAPRGPQTAVPSDLPPVTFGGSAPASPVERQRTNSPPALSDDPGADDDLELEDAEQGEDDDRSPMTAADLRAQKRKMKRFRCAACPTASLSNAINTRIG